MDNHTLAASLTSTRVLDRSVPFRERYRLYAHLDKSLSGYTRFFAAAALTNLVLAQLFRLLPPAALSNAYQFLHDSGAVLKTANLKYARDIGRRTSGGPLLDHYLVSNEQRLVQILFNGRGARANGRWNPIGRELNVLMNANFIVSVVSRLFACSRQYCWILKKIRQKLGLALDFAEESHRVHIGMEIIEHIRNQYPPQPAISKTMSIPVHGNRYSHGGSVKSSRCAGRLAAAVSHNAKSGILLTIAP